VDNLLENADKYSPAEAPIELAASREGDRVVIAVADRGIGVAPGDLPLLFEPFFRGDRGRAGGAGGSGLGLALVRRIAVAHGGAVTAEPRDGGGMRFRLELPVG
jgi:two-component system sensor histidine kinase BaeS